MFVSPCRRYVATRSPRNDRRYFWWFMSDELTETRIEATDVPRHIRRSAYQKMAIRKD
jgi:hypothetical protein